MCVLALDLSVCSLLCGAPWFFATDFVGDRITFYHSSRWAISQLQVESSLGNSRGRHTNSYRGVAAATGPSQGHTQPFQRIPLPSRREMRAVSEDPGPEC